jgi:hypothetical protein
MVAAMMTAANLGVRVTGWGFVVFSVGSLAWTAIAITTNQANLLATNGFLTLVNIVGIWRWLGRQRSYEDGGKSAERKSRAVGVPTLLSATGLIGLSVYDRSETKVGVAVEALLERETGAISYVVVATGGLAGVAETLHAIDRAIISFECERLKINLTGADFANLPALPDGAWPASAPEAKPKTNKAGQSCP